MTEIQVITGLAKIQGTIEELAAVLGVSRVTVYARFKAQPELREAWDNGRMQGKASLRRLLWEHAMRPNASGVTASIFLARQADWLGFDGVNDDGGKGQNQGAHGGQGGSKSVHVLTDDELDKFIELRDKLDRAALPEGTPEGEGAPES